MFDNVSKFLIEHYSPDFASWLIGEPTALTELSPSELSLEPIRADALILLQSADGILHCEFQTDPDSTMPFRMADYALRVFRRFPQKRLVQVVVYLRPTESALVQQTAFTANRMHHEFDVVRLWEQPTEVFFQRPGLLPDAALSQASDRASVLRKVATAIDALADRQQQNNLAAASGILAGLVLDKQVIQRVLRRELMRESVIYQELWEEARQELRLELREAAREEVRQELEVELREAAREEVRQELEVELREAAREEVRLEERLEGERSLILRLLTRKVGEIPTATQSQIATLSIAQLEDLGEALLNFATSADLSEWLERSDESKQSPDLL
jgi:predicted transposase/invertase (TIGR01784 family)